MAVRLAARVSARARNFAFEHFVRTRPRPDLVRLGTDYGGFWIPRDLVGRGSICYLAGLGEDASFDIALAETGCNVWSMDPTPRAIAYATTIRTPGFNFIPVGLWSSDETLRFYAPADPAHVSHSIVNAQGTDEYFEAECRSLGSVMSELGHRHIDLLKMNIEGAESTVLADMLRSGIRPRVLIVAFENPDGVVRDLRRVQRLKRAGFIPVAVQHHSVTFVSA